MPASSPIRATFVTMLFLALMLSAVVPAAAQGPPRTGDGTGGIWLVDETSSRDAGRNRIATRELAGVLVSGPLQGTFEQEVRGVVHASGRVTFQGTMSFTGTAAGCGEVAVVARLTGRGQAGPAPVTDGTFTIIGQTAGAPVTGHGTVHQNGGEISYEVQYVCR